MTRAQLFVFFPRRAILTIGILVLARASAQVPAPVDVDGQPLGANAERVVRALEFLGAPLPPATASAIGAAARARDATALQKLLDELVLFVVDINPELRVKVARGPRPPVLHQNGHTPFLIKIVNEGEVTERLRISSEQGGAVYVGGALNSLQRQQQTHLHVSANAAPTAGSFLQTEMFSSAPMTERLSGLKAEYAIALILSTEAGKREATIGFDVGQGTQDLGFRGEAAVLFNIQPAIPVDFSVRDHDGSATVARLTLRDAQGRIHPSQAKRLAPDLFFQSQIYRADRSVLFLPPGVYEVLSSRGPEYVLQRQNLTVPARGRGALDVRLERWIDPAQHGFYSGDHHIHASGCAHYTSPTEGINPDEVFLQVKGEGLNVGCALTWGPGFNYQRQFFSAEANKVSEPLTLLKYDLEISGFGSASLGHVVLLNLKEQYYPGSDGTTRGWPTWTVPVMRWTKEQGGFAGYPHSDMRVDPVAYAKRFIARHDRNADRRLDSGEARAGLLPLAFEKIDGDADHRISAEELARSAEEASNQLPNLVLPAMRGSGAMEIFVSTTEGVCDFISAMDTGRVGEWNTWYHLMNSGFPLKVSGETDFPCMSGTRVGQGRVYVKMADGPIAALDFPTWCRGLAEGRSYVSDGYAHALEFTVDSVRPGTRAVTRAQPGTVAVRAKVAFAPEVPQAVAHGTLSVEEGRRFVGDTRALYAEPSERFVRGGERLVEVVMNGQVVARRHVPVDGAVHDLSFEVPVKHSSWIALRHFPQMHTNPVEVIVGGRPIRASRESALWCAESVELLWENAHTKIAPAERSAARAAYDRAIAEYRRRADEAN